MAHKQAETRFPYPEQLKKMWNASYIAACCLLPASMLSVHRRFARCSCVLCRSKTFESLINGRGCCTSIIRTTDSGWLTMCFHTYLPSASSALILLRRRCPRWPSTQDPVRQRSGKDTCGGVSGVRGAAITVGDRIAAFALKQHSLHARSAMSGHSNSFPFMPDLHRS